MSKFKIGDKVIYLPPHVNGNREHLDCETGIISYISNDYVFVYYMRNGILQKTAAATRPNNLILF